MPTTRRSFVRFAAAFLSFLPSRLAPASAPTEPATPTPSPSPTPAPGAEALARGAQERYGKFLTAEERKALDERLANLERRSGRLRAIRLANAEEPATEFRVVRHREHGGEGRPR